MSGPELKDRAWGEAEDTAKAIFELVAQKDVRPWPLKLPFGKDALRLIRGDVRKFERDTREWEVIGRTTRKEREESVEFKERVETLGGIQGSEI